MYDIHSLIRASLARLNTGIDRSATVITERITKAGRMKRNVVRGWLKLGYMLSNMICFRGMRRHIGVKSLISKV